MFNNFINRYDFFDLVKKGINSFPAITKKIFSGKKKKVVKAWKVKEYANDNWWDIPEIVERWNLIISGKRDIDYYDYVSKKYWPNQKNLIGFSIGCGTGYRELIWASKGMFSHIYAVDISGERIKKANEEAKAKGYEKMVSYEVEDIFNKKLLSNQFDVIFTEHSLHHFTPLKELMLKLNDSLKPGGYFIVNEFVGPTRFQWTDRQLDAVNSIFTLLPPRLKIKLDGYSKKRKVVRPSKLRMLMSDPSEAVESSKIIPNLREIFDVIELKEYGGTIINLLFDQIAHNFNPENKIDNQWIKIIFGIEDFLLSEEEISSDYALAVCRKK